MMPQFQLFGSLVRDIYYNLMQVYHLALPISIVLAVVIGYFKSDSISQLDILKRAFVATLLLISFPEISAIIINVCDGIAQRIDDMSGIQKYLDMAKEHAHTYANAKSTLLLQFDTIFVAVLNYLSFLIVYIARYLTIAMYYFYWIFLSALSPLLILCYIFPSTAHITKNLYKNLIEIGCWKICWAVLSAMLATLSLGDAHQAEGSYLTVIVLNFVVAIAMLLTPVVVKSIFNEGVSSTSAAIGGLAVTAIARVPMAAMKVGSLVSTGSHVKNIFNKLHDHHFERSHSLVPPIKFKK